MTTTMTDHQLELLESLSRSYSDNFKLLLDSNDRVCDRIEFVKLLSPFEPDNIKEEMPSSWQSKRIALADKFLQDPQNFSFFGTLDNGPKAHLINILRQYSVVAARTEIAILLIEVFASPYSGIIWDRFYKRANISFDEFITRLSDDARVSYDFFNALWVLHRVPDLYDQKYTKKEDREKYKKYIRNEIDLIRRELDNKFSSSWQSDRMEVANKLLQDPERFRRLFGTPNCLKDDFLNILCKYPVAERTEIAILLIEVFGDPRPELTWSKFKETVNDDLRFARVLLHTLKRFPNLVSSTKKFNIAELKKAVMLDTDNALLLEFEQDAFIRAINYFNPKTDSAAAKPEPLSNLSPFSGDRHRYTNSALSEGPKRIWTVKSLSYDFVTTNSLFDSPERPCYWWEFLALLCNDPHYGYHKEMAICLLKHSREVGKFCTGASKVCDITQLVAIIKQLRSAEGRIRMVEDLDKIRDLINDPNAMLTWEHFAELANTYKSTPYLEYTPYVEHRPQIVGMLDKLDKLTALVSSPNRVCTGAELVKIVNNNSCMLEVLLQNADTLINLLDPSNGLLDWATFQDLVGSDYRKAAMVIHMLTSFGHLVGTNRQFTMEQFKTAIVAEAALKLRDHDGDWQNSVDKRDLTEKEFTDLMNVHNNKLFCIPTIIATMIVNMLKSTVMMFALAIKDIIIVGYNWQCQLFASLIQVLGFSAANSSRAETSPCSGYRI